MAKRAAVGAANSFGSSGFIRRPSRGEKDRATGNLRKFLAVVAW
jgi:hypothetical protein